ncbi:MAG: PPC domain-containing protein [Bryobacterales bacterium]
MRKLFACCLFLTPLALHAAGPTLARLDPPGGQAGSTVRLEIVGAGLGGDMKILGEVPGAFTPLTVETGGDRRRPYLVEIDADARTGAYPLRIETNEGVSNILLFTVGPFPETTEEEALLDEQTPLNDNAAKAQAIELPRTVNGTLRGPDRDVYRIHGKKGQALDVEVQARRIGSAIDPVLEVRDAEGKLLARNNDAPGIQADARLSLTLPSDGEYSIWVQDARFSEQRLDFYRLAVGRFQYAGAAFPVSGRRGEALELQLLGGNLDKPQTVRLPASDARWAQAHLEGDAVSLPLPIALTEEPQAMEPGGNGPHELEPDTLMNGRIGTAGERDSYQLAVKPGESWMLETRAGETGLSRLYALLTVSDQSGKKLASAGDQEPETPLSNIVSNSDSAGDPYIALTVPDGVTALEITVEDLLGRGGPEYGYQLTARRQPPDFTLTLNDPYVNIPRGGVEQIDVTLDRRGFEGPVQLSVANAPAGVSVQGGHIPAEFGGMTTRRDSRRGMFVLTADKDAAPEPFTLEVWGEATLPDGTVVRRRATAPGMVAGVSGRGQRAVAMPWLAEDLTGRVSDALPASIELISPKRIKLIQGMVHNIEWEFRSEDPSLRPDGTVNVGSLPIVGNIRVLGGANVKKVRRKASTSCSPPWARPR